MKLLTLHEVAETLAIHYETARRYCKSGELEYVQRPGCAMRVTDIELNKYIERHTQCRVQSSHKELMKHPEQTRCISMMKENELLQDLRIDRTLDNT